MIFRDNVFKLPESFHCHFFSNYNNKITEDVQYIK